MIKRWISLCLASFMLLAVGLSSATAAIPDNYSTTNTSFWTTNYHFVPNSTYAIIWYQKTNIYNTTPLVKTETNTTNMAYTATAQVLRDGQTYSQEVGPINPHSEIWSEKVIGQLAYAAGFYYDTTPTVQDIGYYLRPDETINFVQNLYHRDMYAVYAELDQYGKVLYQSDMNLKIVGYMSGFAVH